MPQGLGQCPGCDSALPTYLLWIFLIFLYIAVCQVIYDSEAIGAWAGINWGIHKWRRVRGLLFHHTAQVIAINVHSLIELYDTFTLNAIPDVVSFIASFIWSSVPLVTHRDSLTLVFVYSCSISAREWSLLSQFISFLDKFIHIMGPQKVENAYYVKKSMHGFQIWGDHQN